MNNEPISNCSPTQPYYSFYRFMSYLMSLLILLFITPFLSAQTFTNDAQVTAWLSPANGVVVHEQVTLNIEVLTDSWFNKGTKIHRFEVTNALVLPQSKFAINSTQKINGKTYTKQLWEIIIFPLQSGEFIIPTITLEVEIKNNQKNAINKTQKLNLTTKQIRFTAKKPALEMSTNKPWMVGNDVELNQQWHITRINPDINNQDAPLQIGDAVKRIVTVKVGNSSAMLLPNLLPNTISNEQFLAYSETPLLKDKQIRGEYLAKKIDAITYIATMPGEITLPSNTLYFWNTESKKLELLNVKGRIFNVQHTLSSWIWFYRFWISGLLLLLSSITICMYWAWRYYNVLKATKCLPLTWQYFCAIYHHQYIECENILYKQQLITNQSTQLSRPLIKKDSVAINSHQHQAWQYEVKKLHNKRYSKMAHINTLPVKFLRLWRLRPRLSNFKN